MIFLIKFGYLKLGIMGRYWDGVEILEIVMGIGKGFAWWVLIIKWGKVRDIWEIFMVFEDVGLEGICLFSFLGSIVLFYIIGFGVIIRDRVLED